MDFEYDSWNRIKQMTYPDGEVVSYQYDLGGQLFAMAGDKFGTPYRIIDSIFYDKFGARALIAYGNGTNTQYEYEPYRRRLAGLQTFSGSSALMDLTYSYDEENNITGISNSAFAVNGLGGNYSYNYEYDNMYRLVNAGGSFTDNQQKNYTFELAMSYSPSGNILSKNMDALTYQSGVGDVAVFYENTYAYNYSQPHAIRQINGSGGGQDLHWDLNGNLTRHIRTEPDLDRRLCWDEENRLTAVRDQNNMSAYIYDAGGERVWKLTGQVQQMYVDGMGYVDVVGLNNKTLYASPYLVYNEQGYSKHYYAGAERVSSRIGGGMLQAPLDPFSSPLEHLSEQENWEAIATDLLTMLKRGITCTEFDVDRASMESLLFSIGHSATINDPEENWYIYHSDHLGSSAFLTDASGDPTQHLQYMPFGETFVEQRSITSYYTPYTFSAKERDPETGYSYFGARYYSSDISVWLSVDPMADKAPGWTPYRYCLNNPLNNIDNQGLIEWPLAGNTAVNKSSAKNGGWGLKNTVVRTSIYRDTDRPVGASNPHQGIDYRAQIGTTFYSLGDGIVTDIGSSNRGGNYITVQYSNGDQVTFRHLQSTYDGLKKGSTVLEGQPLGTTGNSGTVNAHLHIEAKNNAGEFINPEGTNYGTVSNEEFFTKFGGNYQKLNQYKQQQSEEVRRKETEMRAAMYKPNTYMNDNTSVVTQYTNYSPILLME
jgi:RHS repeat-associated protein